MNAHVAVTWLQHFETVILKQIPNAFNLKAGLCSQITYLYSLKKKLNSPYLRSKLDICINRHFYFQNKSQVK